MCKVEKKCILALFGISVVLGLFVVHAIVFGNPNAKTSTTVKKYYMPEEDNGVCYEYYQNEYDKWCVNGHEYDERVVLIGTMPLASCETQYVVLTNDEKITFDEVMKSVVSSNSNDELDVERACIVEVK